jgi:hypothetical protein
LQRSFFIVANRYYKTFFTNRTSLNLFSPLQDLAIFALVKDAVDHVGIIDLFAPAKGNKGGRYDLRFKQRVTDFVDRRLQVAAAVVLCEYLVHHLGSGINLFQRMELLILAETTE